MIRKLFIVFGLSLWPVVCFAFAVSAPGLAPVSKTSNYTLTCSDNGTYFDNAGATGTVTFTLPSAPCVGQINCFTVVAPNTVNVALPGGSTLWLGTASATGQFQATQEASSLCEYAQSTTTFVAYASNGAWTGSPQTITSITLPGGQKYTGGAAPGTNISSITVGGADNGAATLAISGPDANLFQLSSGCTAASCQLQTAQKASFTATISGTTLTVTAVGSGVIESNDLISGTGVTAGTTIIAQLTSTATGNLLKGIGTYALSASSTVSSGETMTSVPADGSLHIYLTATLAGATGSGVKYPFEIAAQITCNSTIATGFTQATITTAIGNASGTSRYNICLQGSGTIASTVAVNKALVRITGVNQYATSGLWLSAMPSVTVSSGVLAFNVSANNVMFDHVNGIGPDDDPGVETDSCPATSNAGQSEFVYETGSPSGVIVQYVKAGGFHCTLWAAGTNTSWSYNSVNDYRYVGIFCHVTTTCLLYNNLVTNVRSPTHEVNAYPTDGSSSDGISTFSVLQNNQIFNNGLWLCMDAHGGTDQWFLNNYCLAQNTSAGIGSINITGGVTLCSTDGTCPATRPRMNGNVTDIGTAPGGTTGTIALLQGSVSGAVLTCTGGDGNGCQVQNNTSLGSYATNVCANNGACLAGTISGTQTVSGNTTGTAATMAAPSLTTDVGTLAFVANQANGVIGVLSVVMTPAFPSWVGGWPNYGGWPGAFTMCEGANCSTYTSSTTHFTICVDGQHVCQVAAGVPAGTYKLRFKGTLTGLSNSPQNSAADVTVTGS